MCEERFPFIGRISQPELLQRLIAETALAEICLRNKTGIGAAGAVVETGGITDGGGQTFVLAVIDTVAGIVGNLDAETERLQGRSSRSVPSGT
jgi:hypothetical protein